MRVPPLCGRVGRAGLPGALWCASPFPFAALSFCFAWPPPGCGGPTLFRCCCRSSLPCAPLFFFLFRFFFFSPLLSRAPVLSGFLWFLAPGALGLGAVFWLFPLVFAASLSVRSRLVCVSRLAVGCSPLVPAPPPSPFVSRGFRRSCWVPWGFFFVFFFFFFFLPAPPLSPVFSGFRPRVPWALALCVVCFVRLPLLGSPCTFPSFVLSAWSLAAPWWLLPPPPFFPRFSSLLLGAVCCVLCCAVCPWVRCCAALLRVVSPGVVLSCAVLLCCARLVPLLVAPCPLRRCVLQCSPALCALCCVCFVVARWCMLLFAALLCAVCVPGCCAVRSLSSPLCAVLCFAVLVRSRCAVRVVRAVAGAWCCGALLCVVLCPLVCRGAALGLVARGCLLVACFGVGVPVWPRGLLPCGWCGLLCRVLWWCAVAWCCAVVLCCRVAVLLGLALPFCGLSCCAVLCCWDHPVLNSVVTGLKGAQNTCLCTPNYPRLRMEKHVFDTFITQFCPQKSPFSRHFGIFHGPKPVTTGSKQANNTCLSIPNGPVSLLEKRVLDPLLTHFWSQKDPLSRHFGIFHGPERAPTGSKWAKNSCLSIPDGPVSLLEKRVLDPFLTHFWSQKDPLSRHFGIFHGPERATTGSKRAKSTCLSIPGMS